MAEKLFDQMYEREEADVKRLRGVGDFIRQDQYLSILILFEDVVS